LPGGQQTLGLLTQAPPGIDSLELRIKNFILKRGHPYDSVYLGIPHRLDRPASGAMVFLHQAPRCQATGRTI